MNKKNLCLAIAGISLPVILIMLLTGCAGLEDKAVAIASGVDAMKVETTGSISSGTVLPNLILGGAVNSICTAPAFAKSVTAQPTYSKSRRNSLFGSVFGIDDHTETIAYTGVPGETADETAKRCKALAGLSTPSASKAASAGTSSTPAASVKTE